MQTRTEVYATETNSNLDLVGRVPAGPGLDDLPLQLLLIFYGRCTQGRDVLLLQSQVDRSDRLQVRRGDDDGEFGDLRVAQVVRLLDWQRGLLVLLVVLQSNIFCIPITFPQWFS